ncbi:MAG: hypothetical protein HQM12_19645 [SAR324 cluster bacterium]|nr:hypothetical protein [SAR324 cluster bacterium]
MPSIVVGTLSFALGLWSLFIWWWSVAEFLRGFTPIALILFGLIAIGASMSTKEKENRTKDKKDNDL